MVDIQITDGIDGEELSEKLSEKLSETDITDPRATPALQSAPGVPCISFNVAYTFTHTERGEGEAGLTLHWQIRRR